MDGLGLSLLKIAYNSKAIPNIAKFFIDSHTTQALSLVTFPSLTFPSISSILTTKAIAYHQVLGNKFIHPLFAQFHLERILVDFDGMKTS